MFRLMLAMALAMAATAVAQEDRPDENDATVVAFFIGENAAAPDLKEVAIEGTPNERTFLHAEPVLTGEHLVSARAVKDERGSPAVEIVLSKAGREKFAQATRQAAPRNPNDGYKRVALVVGGKVMAAPRIVTAIDSERVQISGNFTQPDIDNLVKSILARAKKGGD